MVDSNLEILLIEDNPGDARLIEEMLRETDELFQRVAGGTSTDDGAQLHREDTLSTGLERLSETDVDVILLDLGLPDSTGLDTLDSAVDAAAFAPIIVLTGLDDKQVGVEAVQRGAQEYLVKDELTSDLLVRSIHHAIERDQQERERAQQRDRLEALNELTRDLMGAETPAQVSEIVVEAAEKRLHRSIMGIALYDEQDNSLSPAAMTAAAAEIVRVTSLLDIGDGAGWQAFVTNEHSCVSAPLDDPEDAVDLPVSEVAIFPLSQHGILIVGSTAVGGFNSANFEIIETAARNVEAALDRVDREQQLHEREQTLEERTNRLERLNRVNTIIRDIDQALIQASTQQEIETVVCDQLAAVGPYELAWIGNHDTTAEEITSREAAGDENNYLDTITYRTDTSSDAGAPTSQAVKTSTPQVVNNLLTKRSNESWQQEALSRNYQSVIALPLQYDDTLYGVLTVYADSPNAFNELEQAVLTELTNTIAYAMNAVERKKALLSTEVTQLQFTVTDSNLEIAELARKLNCKVVVENLVPRSDGGVQAFFTTQGVPVDDVRELVPQLPTRSLSLVSEYEEDGEQVNLFGANLTAESLSATILEHGGQVQAFRIEEGVATITIELAADADIRRFVEMFQRQYPDSELVAKQTRQQSSRSAMGFRASLTDELTDRQLETLKTAYFNGFFENPRKQTGTEIASSLGIAQPTFNGHLREAQRKLCQKLFHEEQSQN